jgi:hypothetical protein
VKRVWGVKMVLRGGFEKRRMKMIVLFAFFAAVFFAGCFNPTEPGGPATNSRILVVHVAGESPAKRTALPPAPAPAKYAITVTRGDASLGGDTFTAGAASYSVELTADPAEGDLVQVEGLDGSDIKIAGGTYTLAPVNFAAPPAPVAVILRPLTEGAGDVRLRVSFDRVSADGEVTLAELKLYSSLQDYKDGNDLGGSYGARYRKNDGLHGTGTDFSGSTPEIIPIEYDDLPWGNYVVMIEFFRDDPVSGVPARVSRLVQTIIVRGGLETNLWDGNTDTLAWDAFASSNAELAGTEGIKIDGTTITGYSPAENEYNIYKPTTSIPTGTTVTLALGEPGQTITVDLNKQNANIPLESGVAYTFEELEDLGAGSPGLANTLVIIVTAPDGFTEKAYMVNISGNEIIDFYFEINAQKYGVGDGVANGSGSISGTDGTGIAVTLPYGTVLSSLPAPFIKFSGTSIEAPEAGTAWGSYRVIAADTTKTRTYAVTVETAKIKSLKEVNGSFTASDGFTQTGGSVSGADIKAKITSVTGTDSLDRAITLAEADYLVADIVGAAAGTTEEATLKVPGSETFDGSEKTISFDVYIKKDAKAITDFYFTIGSKHYGVGTDVTVESGSGSITGTAPNYTIKVTVPYGTNLADMAATASHTGDLISPDPEESRSYAGTVNYEVTAEDDSTATYAVTVVDWGITIDITGPEGFADLTLSVSPTTVEPGDPITIAGDKSFASCYVYISGPVNSSSTDLGPGESVTFPAPMKRGFYNINVIVTINNIPYSGSFGLAVE